MTNSERYNLPKPATRQNIRKFIIRIERELTEMSVRIPSHEAFCRHHLTIALREVRSARKNMTDNEGKK